MWMSVSELFLSSLFFHWIPFRTTREERRKQFRSTALCTQTDTHWLIDTQAVNPYGSMWLHDAGSFEHWVSTYATRHRVCGTEVLSTLLDGETLRAARRRGNREKKREERWKGNKKYLEFRYSFPSRVSLSHESEIRGDAWLPARVHTMNSSEGETCE